MKAKSPDIHQQVAMDVLKQFRIVFGAVRQHFGEVEKSCGVSGSQLWVLHEIKRAPGLTVSDLADRLAIHQSTCSQLVEKLARSGTIAKQRSSVDQRKVGLKLTPAGRALLKKAPGPAEGVLPDALRSLPDVALRTLHVNLEALIQRINPKDAGHAQRPLADL